MTEEARETVKRILVHIIEPLSRYDRLCVIEHLCDTFSVREYDPYD